MRRYGDDNTGARRARRPPARDASSPATTPTTTCRSRSSPTTRRCCDQIAGWGWQDGLLPSPQAPVWPMDSVPRPLPHRVRAMRQDDRTPFERALQRARVSAYAPGEFVGQESFMTAGEIRALAARAGIGPGVSVLDLGCGVAGPGRFLTRELGCDYLGVDSSASAVALARERAAGLPCRFAVAHAPPLPGRPLRRRAPARGDARLRGQGRADARGRRRARARRALRLHARGGRAAHRRRARRDARPRHGLAHARSTTSPPRWSGPGSSSRRLEDHSAEHRATAQALIDAYAADADGHRRAARPPRARRHPRRPPAVGRVAGLGPGAQVRPHRLRARLGATRGGSSGCFG